jgi:hypothetical protein
MYKDKIKNFIEYLKKNEFRGNKFKKLWEFDVDWFGLIWFDIVWCSLIDNNKTIFSTFQTISNPQTIQTLKQSNNSNNFKQKN